MKRNWIVVLFAVLTIGLSSCKRYPPYIPQSDPSEACYEPFPSGAAIYHHDINYSLAQFNPGQPEQIVYMRRFKALDFGDVWNYNLQTRQAFPIVSQTVLRVKNFSCGKFWIALETTNKEIWKIKYDGSGLTRISQIAKGSHPSWSADGTQLMIYTETGNQGMHRVTDADGNTIKTIQTGSKIARFTTQPDVILGFQTGADKRVFQYSTQYKKTIRSFPVDEKDGLANVTMLPNNYEMLMTKKWGIYKVNLIDTQYTVQLREMCWKQYYDRPSLSPDGHFVVFTKTITEMSSPERLNQREEIWLMDSDCQRAQHLFLP